jgi:hypothetical protein
VAPVKFRGDVVSFGASTSEADRLQAVTLKKGLAYAVAGLCKARSRVEQAFREERRERLNIFRQG